MRAIVFSNAARVYSAMVLEHRTIICIIPALNEEQSIGQVLAAIPAWVDRVIVVDNGSTDATAAIAVKHGAVVVSEPQRGYGAACLAGLRLATATVTSDPLSPSPLGERARVWGPVEHGRANRIDALQASPVDAPSVPSISTDPLTPTLSTAAPGEPGARGPDSDHVGLNHNADIFVFLDADFSDDPGEMELLVAPILCGEAELVIGSRVLGKRERGALTPQQRFGNWLACTLMRWFWGTRYTDLGPFRAITRQALAQLKMDDRGYGWTVQMQIRAARLKLPIREVPVSYRKRIGQSKISGTIRGAIGAGTKILRVIFRERLGRK